MKRSIALKHRESDATRKARPAPGASGPRRKGGAPAASIPRSRRRWIFPLAALIVLGAVLYVARRPLLVAMGGMLVASDPLEKADAALVLGGDDSFQGTRTRTAIRLYRQGWVRKLVLSGPRLGYGVYETEFSQPLAISQGVPKGDIWIYPHTARSTLEETRILAPLLERRGIRSVYVVTANFHTRRARRAFIHASGGRMRVLAHPAPDTWFEPNRWWESREGRKIFFLESAKTVNLWLETLLR